MPPPQVVMMGSAASRLEPRVRPAAHSGQARRSVRHCSSRTGIHSRQTASRYAYGAELGGRSQTMIS